MMQKLSPLTYQIEEAAALLGIGRSRCYEAARTGEIPAIRIGRRLLVPRAALERLLEGTLPKSASVDR
jgi:excisionase family DNA binding protein